MAIIQKVVDPLLAERLRSLIKFSGLSQKEFASFVGVTTRTLSFWISESKPINPKFFLKIMEVFRNHNVDVSDAWFSAGEGEGPRWISKKQEATNVHQEKVFNHFNLDYTFSVLTEIFRQSYPNVLHLFVPDEAYYPRIKPQTLLIAVGMDQEKYRDNWEFGYLLKQSEYRMIPVDVVRRENGLFATPFPMAGFNPMEIVLEPQEQIFPIINIRPLY